MGSHNASGQVGSVSWNNEPATTADATKKADFQSHKSERPDY